MKKIVGIFIFVMIAALMVAMAYGESGTYYGPGSEAQSLIEKWASENGGEKYIEKFTEDGIYRICGALDVKGYEEYFDVDFTWEDYETRIRSQYNMIEFQIFEIGQIDGYTIYLIEGYSEQDIEDGYQKVSIMTMMYRE